MFGFWNEVEGGFSQEHARGKIKGRMFAATEGLPEAMEGKCSKRAQPKGQVSWFTVVTSQETSPP